jgi:8-oxo-dGTP pyrophosphatase MutT (NUDIX family)
LERALEQLRKAIGVSIACADLRYAREVSQSVAELLVAHFVLLNRPDVVALPELVTQYGIDEAALAFAFRSAERRGLSYVAEIDERTAERTGLAILSDKVHGTRCWHGTVSVLLVDEDGCVAVQERGETPSRGKRDVSAAGHIDPGEDDISAAARETEEELGIALEDKRFIRLGEPYEFRKEGSPSMAHDEHKQPTYYLYNTDKLNCERISVFLTRISAEEKAHLVVGEGRPALKVEWMTVREAAREASEHPERYASSFKQLFGCDETLRRITELIGQME